MPSYIELLQDPRWQKKRLEVLSLNNFCCSKCGNKRLRLDVHHKKYRHGAMPWEYEDDELEVLCKLCHETEHVELTPEEIELENKIKDACKALLEAQSVSDKKNWFGAMRTLIASRSPALIRKLELTNGLAK